MMIGSWRSASTPLTALAVAAMLLAACSSSTGAAGPTTNAAIPALASPLSVGGAYAGGYGANDAGTTGATAATAAPGASAYEIKAASGSTGTYLTGEDEMTLYVFKKDPQNASACADACAANWPPFTLDPDESVKAGAGVNGNLTTFKRTDGRMQVAYNGAPVYYFAADKRAGETNGQGVNGVWFVAQP